MQYSKIQKSISSLLLFSMFFSLTFRIPLFDFKVFAWSAEYYDLVSVIVDQDSYDEVKSELNRYAEDIQWVLENTKVVIIPTPINTPSFNISSLNESLYFDWYKWVDESVSFESKLVWTVLVWNFNLPIVFDWDNSSRTILPFTDFEDKQYIYNHETNRYEANDKNINWLKSEIWHWVISPNFWDFDKNIDWLKNYFDKNHDFYKWTWDFQYSQWILNWTKNEVVPASYEPFVFYYDQFREEKALNYSTYKWYEAYLNNKEDIVYSRFTKELANSISDFVLWESTETVSSMVNNLSDKIDALWEDSPFWKIPEEAKSWLSQWPDTSMSPDIQTRFITENMTKKFLEIFAKWVIWDFRTNVHNAWRYNWIWWEVNADLIPYLVTVLDIVNDWIIQDVNTDIENEIDNLVKNWLSRNIAIPSQVKEYKLYNYNDWSWLGSGLYSYYDSACYDLDVNYLYWNKVSNINSAAECSIYRWNTENGWKLVEANRWLNFENSLPDKDRIDNTYCLANLKSWASLDWIWWWSSPLNIDRTKAISWIIELADYNTKWAIESLFDIWWSKQNSNLNNNPSPLDCFDNNLLSDTRSNWSLWEESWSTCNVSFKTKSTWWSCTTDNTNLNNTFNTRFEDFYKNSIVSGISNVNDSYCASTDERWLLTEFKDNNTSYNINKYYTKKVYSLSSTWSLLDFTCEKAWLYKEYNFKYIPSYITHKSPTAPELQWEIKAATTQSLPVDKDRYIDFIWAKWNLLKIDYPALFRVDIWDKTKITLDSVSESLDKILESKSDEINNLINENNPSSLNWKDLELYNILKVDWWLYPSANFDLVKFLKDKPNKTFNVWDEEKTISYYDTLVFAIYWNSLSSVSAKYWAIFDNYLNDSTISNDKYFLPKGKKEYEIAYLWAEGDAKNMYIKMDPEGKAENPYWDVLSKNIDLSSLLLWSNIWGWNIDNEEALFKCAPPDWVPIWEWIPAVMCRLWEMMPPTISLWDWDCWPSILDLLSDDEIAELNSCNGDFDKNWINDCIESKLWDNGILELSADSEKYFYNKNADLKAIFRDKKWKIITLLNNSNVKFEVVKIEAAKNNNIDISETNKEVVFDINDIYKNNKEILSKYISFNSIEIPTVQGIANYWVWLKSFDSNIFLKANLVMDDFEWNESIYMESDELVLKIRWDRLFNSSYKLENSEDWLLVNSWLNYLKVSDKTNIFIADKNNGSIWDIQNIVNNSSLSSEKLVLLLDNISSKGKSIPIEYPLNIKIKDSDSKILTQMNLNKWDLSLFKWIVWIKKSGSYSIEVTDWAWFKTTKNIELLPEIPHTVDTHLWATLMEAGWNVSTNFFTIYDKYLNVISWEFYNYEIKIDWKWLVFLEDDSVLNKWTTFEWFKIFRLKSTNKSSDNKIKVTISDSNDNKIIEWERGLKVLDEINFETILLSDDIKVWYNKYKFQINLKDKDGNLLSDFNSRVYLNANPVYISTSWTYVEVKWWTAEIEFETKTVAWKDVWIEFQVEWLNDIVKKQITILPGDPMKIDLVLNQSKLEASLDALSKLNVELKDRYNNVVFNDNTTKTSIEILDQYSHIIESNKKFQTVEQWVWSYDLSATLNPWVAYFKVSTIPSLENNSFIIKDNNWDVEVKWVWSNAWKIETFYFWNDSKIEWKKYNSLYTNLLGSNYWDIEEENYLAWSLLFNKANRSLAVTSLLNNPFKYSDVLSLWDSWNLNIVYSTDDLSQDISVTTEFIDNKIALNLFNQSLKTYIWKILYNFDDNIKLVACESDLNSCVNNDETSISLKSFSNDYDVFLENNELVFKNINWKILFTINDDWTINRSWILSFDFNKSNTGDFLSININSWSNKVGELWISFKDSKTSISRSEDSFNAKITNIKNSLLVLLRTNSYWTYSAWNIYNKNTVFYYNDPFKNEKSLNTFSKSNIYWVENFVNKPWIWWKEWNKSLLEFASGKSVWESVKDYMSFSVINLWDPVLSLKKIKNQFTWTDIDRQFDSTIWKLLSSDDDISDYRTFDYDADNKPDILLIKDNKYFKLLENKDINWWFIDKWNLSLIVDLWALDLVQTWDFTWDWYEDIFFVNNKWEPFLLNNTNKDFNRYSLSNIFNLEWKIVRAKSFDMDNDSLSDIVTLDDAWAINIFYGKWTSSNPDFTKLTVSNDNWIKLSWDIRNDNWLIYYDWLYQPSWNSADSNQFERQIFVKYPYDSEKQIVDYEKVLNLEEELPTNVNSTYLMKSQYWDYAWLKVEKSFIDVNEWFISSNDIIDVSITLTNTSDKKLENILYAEKVPEAFSIDESSVDILWILEPNIIEWNLWYHFLTNGFDLDIDEQIIITYEAKVRPIQYWYIDVWLFENWEVWDDSYGDILVKKDNQNCSNPVEIIRSLWIDNPVQNTRLYQKWTKSPTCDEDKVKLPPELEQNTIDVDWNWIPDYIDELSNPNNTSWLQEYANEQLSLMYNDKDNDWVPDDEDFLEWWILDSIFTWTAEFEEDSLEWNITIWLWEDLQKVDAKLDNAQEILNWLNCGNASCFASPLNWAPLAPGWDPVFMWKTIWDGLNIDEWLPIISAMTGFPLYWPWWCIPIPMIWPISPIWLDTTCSSNSLWAWGRLGVDSVTNFFRMFVTPTLTGWIWTAICFGWPASAVWNIMPEWLSPLFPGWNCIVIAKKFMWCSDDWSDWDPSSIWTPYYSWNWSFWIINWNCWTSQTENEKANEDKDILRKLYESDWAEAVQNIFDYLPWDFSEEPITPLFDADPAISLDLSWDNWWSFADVIKIQQTRISSFPSWLMDWVTRQIEEIVNKLTDFPTVFIILPDFSWVFDKNWWENSWNSDKYNKEAVTLDKKISSWTWAISKALTDWVWQVNSWIKEAYEFIWWIPLVYIEQETVDITLPWISQAEIDKTIALREKTLEQREDEVERAKEEWSMWAACNRVVDTNEVNKINNDTKLTSDEKNKLIDKLAIAAQKEQEKCKEDNAAWTHVNANIDIDFWIDSLLSWLRKNLEVIKSYKEIPEKINKLINVKEDYLEQILCNIESISNILGWRIWKNGDRFKAWVELYILIKAILKSWQLLIDVFIDYETECHECKNERQDALDSEFNLISFIVPQIPIIQFPKWPDIIIDLHNIRAWLTVALPEFAINTKPILLPLLPQLKLPNFPDVNFNVSVSLDIDIPVLPEIEIPELPPLPNLPSVELPDLPPPPKLPKMLASIEVVLDIIKLIAKAMCILKSLPIHPEWRAWDQIAFLTERSWYLWSDFFEISMPEFSFPFIDAIEVTTYVNLEFETEFIVELARQIAMPLNSFTNDFTNIFETALPDLDLSNLISSEDINVDVDIRLWTDDLKKIWSWDFSPIDEQIKWVWESLEDVWNDIKENYHETVDTIEKEYKDASDTIEEDINDTKDNLNDNINNLDDNIQESYDYEEGIFNDQIDDIQNNIDDFGYNLDNFSNKELQLLLATKVWSDFNHLVKIIADWKDDVVSNVEFKKLVNKALSSENVTSDPKMSEILSLWNTVNNMTYSKEDLLIKDLQDNNRSKFDALNDIINTEIIKNRELKRQLINVWLTPVVTKVWYNEENKIDLYNETLEKYNNKFYDSAKKLIEYDDTKNIELKESAEDIISRIKTPLQNYSNWISTRSDKKILASVNNDLLSSVWTTNSDTVAANSCQWQVNSDYERTYEWIFVIEWDKSYRLFDYLDELEWDEIMKIIDIDWDQDDDIIYSVNNKIYLKENLEKTDNKVYLTESPLTLDIDDNKFFNGDIFYEAINNAHEIWSDNWNINIWFSSPTNRDLNKFRLSFYDRVDKYLNEDNSWYIPEFIKKDIVDAISDINIITKTDETESYIKRKNLVYIKNIWNLLWVKLTSKELIDISKDLSLGSVVNISKWTKIYAWENNFSMTYINSEWNDLTEKTISISSYSNIEFLNNIKIVWITSNAYIEWFDDVIYEWTDIRKVLNKPIFVWTKISYVWNNYETVDTSYIDLEYYDGSFLWLDFNKVKDWELYDLWFSSEDDYTIRINRSNDYYYSKLYTFNNNINSTISNQILIAPQNEADMNSPELNLPNIRIPVYQKALIDLTNEIYEDSWIWNIKEVIIDFDLESDTDNDWNKKNDDDINIIWEYKDQINILKSPWYLKLDFEAFDKLIKKKIWITLIDSNGNAWYKEVLLEVYSPVPNINTYENWKVWGVLIQEKLTEEPINIFRFRWGVVTKLENDDWSWVSLTNDWNYSFNISNEWTWLKLYDWDKNEIAFINEKTWKINIKDYFITSEVLSSSNIKNDSVFPKIILKKNDKEIFYEYLQIKWINKVNFVNNFEEVIDKWIYFKFSDYNNYSYYTVPEWLDYNPWALSIYRNTSESKEALFTIFKDWRINSINDDDFNIKYDFYWDYIVLKLFDKNDFSNREIWRILFMVDSEYIMK